MSRSLVQPARPLAFSLWLDFFRWGSAVIVLLSHEGGMVIVPLYGLDPGRRTWVHYVYSAFAGYSHEAVMIFFVLSGFLVGGSFYSEVTEGRESLAAYFLKRIVRLWIVLIPALALSAALMQLGLQINPAAAVEQFYGTGPAASWPIFFCNMAFLQNIACERFADNGPLWSLCHEFWYYVSFPLLCLAVFSRRPFWLRALLAVGALAILCVATLFQFTAVPLAPYFLIWLLGVAVAMLRPSSRLLNIQIATAALFLSLLMDRLGGGHVVAGLRYAGFWTDLLTSMSFAYLILCLKWTTNLKEAPGGRLNHGLAAFSFSLYCVHRPILLIYGLTMQRITSLGLHMVPKDPDDWSVVVSGFVLTMILSWVFSKLTEAHTDRVRRFLFAHLSVGGRTLRASFSRRWFSAAR